MTHYIHDVIDLGTIIHEADHMDWLSGVAFLAPSFCMTVRLAARMWVLGGFATCGPGRED